MPTEIMQHAENEIAALLYKSLPAGYLHEFFTGALYIDDLINQVILECVKAAYDSTREKHSVRYYLSKMDQNSDDIRMRYSRLMAISNNYKRKELSLFEKQYGVTEEQAYPPVMQDITDRLDGYQLSEMNFFEITNIGDLELIKAIINHRLGSSKKIPNNHFRDIAFQYDKFVISLMEQCKESDEKAVFNSLAYFTIEWKYAFDFMYSCVEAMAQFGIREAETAYSKIGILLGYRSVISCLGFQASADSRMVGYREGLIPAFFQNEKIIAQYSEMLALTTRIKERASINGVPIKEWFVQNTGIQDWAIFFREYDVFKYARRKKDYSNSCIRDMRGLTQILFPENPEKRSYSNNQNDGTFGLQNLKEVIPMVKLNCYIEEYQNEKGALCARLRDKASNKRVVILGDSYDKEHLIQFLSAAKKHMEIMPTVYDRDGTDSVAVRGVLHNEGLEIIEIGLEGPGAGYLFQ